MRIVSEWIAAPPCPVRLTAPRSCCSFAHCTVAATSWMLVAATTEYGLDGQMLAALLAIACCVRLVR